MTVVTRFAPSPTGFLHIGGARTALFNWLLARHMGGQFLLRIEDTDLARSTTEAVEAIFSGLKWLGLSWAGEPVFQSRRARRHQQVAQALCETGAAYRCYCTPDELAAMKEKARQEGRPPLYDGRWRDSPMQEEGVDRPFAVRLKTAQLGETVFRDHVQGVVRVQNTCLDDMVLLRSDGTPTYMLSVVVDDHDMGVTHVVRGDDHLTNTFRQIQLYHALGWSLPDFAHIPLIHGSDGKKLSKRHGALSVEAYKDLGFLPQAMVNYLLRLGWSHQNDEIFSREQAIAWFTLEAIGRSPGCFDLKKLLHVNAHYLRCASPVSLLEEMEHGDFLLPFSKVQRDRLCRGLVGLQKRAKTLQDLKEAALIYLHDTISCEPELFQRHLGPDTASCLTSYFKQVVQAGEWTSSFLEDNARRWTDQEGLKLGQLAQPLRVVLTGQTVSPPIFEVMDVLGQEVCLLRWGLAQRFLASGGRG